MTTKKSLTLASKNSNKKSPTAKRQMGRAAFDKGRKFEDQVAELYKLLGAKVEQNIEIHQKKVDILATFRIPGSSHKHRVIVECKDETRSVAANQRVMAFKGLLDLARATGVADSAETLLGRLRVMQQKVSLSPLGSSFLHISKRYPNSST